MISFFTAGQSILSHTMKALSYCRVSTVKQAEDDKTSLDDQAKANEVKLRSLGCTDIEVVNDEETGTKWEERRELGPALKKIEDGYYHFVCVYNVDRAVRTWEFIALLSLSCKKGNARLVFATRDYDQSTFGDLMMVIDAFRAQWGREDIIKNMNRGRRGRIESGKVHRFGPELYGYRRDKEHGVRVIYEPEAAVVRRIFDLKAGGCGYYEIAKRLNADAIPTPGRSKNFTRRNSSGYWMPMTVKDLVRNPAYKGEGVAWTRKRNGAGKAYPTNEADRIKVPAETTPAIVSPETWQRANDIALSHRGDRARNNSRPILLRGLVICNICARRLWYDPDGVYRCRRTWAVAGKPGQCTGKPVNAVELEKLVWEKALEILREPERLQWMIEVAQTKGDSAADLRTRIDSAQSRLAEIDRQQRILLEQLISSDDPTWHRLVETKRSELTRQRSQVTEEIAALDRARSQVNQAASQALSLVEQCRRLKNNLDDYDFNDKRRTLEWLGVQIRASGGFIRIAIGSGKVYEIPRYAVYNTGGD